MGRPSLADQRTAQILDAFERCIARLGLDGCSLNDIATEAGMKRSILRHYVGNREDLVHSLADRVIGKYQTSLQDHLAASAALRPTEQLLTYLFPRRNRSSTESIVVIESLIAASECDPEIRDRIRAYIDWLVTQSARLLKEDHPHSKKENCWAVAYGVIALCFNQESLTPLGLPVKYARSARRCAETLIASLDS
ncbi:MAG: TetR/AcrR family transcriptional regulator [Planctomycetota bacterium]